MFSTAEVVYLKNKNLFGLKTKSRKEIPKANEAQRLKIGALLLSKF